MNYTRVSDNVAVRPAPTGSTHAPGWYGPNTTVDYEDMNGILGEIAAAIVALGGTLDTDTYDQLATQLTETVLTNGRFDASVWIGNKNASPGTYGTQIDLEAGFGSTQFGRVQTQKSYATIGFYIGNNPLTATEVIDSDCDATLRNIEATGNAEFGGEVTATGGLSTVTPAKFVAAYDLTDMRWEVTIDAIGGIIEIPFDSSFPLDGAILKMTNSKFGSGSRMYCQPVAPPTLTQTHGFVVNVNTDGEMYFHDAAAAIEETVQVWFDIINPV